MRPVLEGKRVRLRPPTGADVAFATAFANDAELRGFLSFYRPTSEAEELDWLRSLRDEGDLVWLMEDARSGEPFGFLSLVVSHVPRVAELGLGILGSEKRGQGIGREAIGLALAHAFDSLRLQRVFLNVFADNPAVRLYEQLGLRVEGRLRRHAFKRGEYRDQLVMAILREEWSA